MLKKYPHDECNEVHKLNHMKYVLLCLIIWLDTFYQNIHKDTLPGQVCFKPCSMYSDKQICKQVLSVPGESVAPLPKSRSLKSV